MGTATLSKSAPERPTASVYWRRRFVALVLGLSVFALVAWAVSGVMGGTVPAAHRGATKSVHRTLPTVAPHPTVAPYSAGGGQPQGSPTAQPAVVPHPSGSAQPRRSPAAAAHHRGSTGMQPCPAADVVLTVFSGQVSYSARQLPVFEVNVVSVAGKTCTFNIGARYVWLQISAGPVKIWSSAECAEGQASLVTQLRRGVPTVLPIGWDDEISGPGCPGPGTRAAAGSYTAVASDAHGSSNTVAFRIG